jgi:hypothetical protein
MPATISSSPQAKFAIQGKKRTKGYRTTMAGIEILDAQKVATLLNISIQRVIRLAENGDLPGYDDDDGWTFERNDIDAYIDEQKRKVSNRTKERKTHGF